VKPASNGCAPLKSAPSVSEKADPRRATPELGEKHFTDTVEHLSAIILQELNTIS